MRFASSVTAPLRASARPSSVALVSMQGRHALGGLDAVRGLADHRDARVQLQQRPDSLANEELVIGDQDADQAAPLRRASRAVTPNPRPACEEMRSSPPARSPRSRIPRSPKPSLDPSLP